MATYIIRRLLAMIPALLGISLITFVLMHLTQGGPFASEHSSPAIQAAMMHAYRLDQPIWPTFIGPNGRTIQLVVLVIGILAFAAGIFMVLRHVAQRTVLPGALISLGVLMVVWYVLMSTQAPGVVSSVGFVPGQYLNYLNNLIHGNLGTSFSFPSQSVNDIIGSAAKASLLLGVSAFLLLVVTAVPLGMLAAVKQNTWLDYSATAFSLVGYSIPNFVLGIIFILLTGVWVKVIPVAEWATFPRDLVLPAIVLAIRPLAVLTRLTRASMIEVLNQDYVRTAWAKGLSSRIVLIRHALRNALLPVVTVMGDHLGDLITGSIVVETLFNVPGIGQWFVNSVQSRDYGMIMGTTLFYATLVLLINLVVDVMYGFIDPRIKLGAGARS